MRCTRMGLVYKKPFDVAINANQEKQLRKGRYPLINRCFRFGQENRDYGLGEGAAVGGFGTSVGLTVGGFWVGGECVAVGGFGLGGLGVLVGFGDGVIFTCVGGVDVDVAVAEGVMVEVAVDTFNLYEHRPGPVTPELKSFNASIIANSSCCAESDN